jgi:predicted dehydrogenase
MGRVERSGGAIYDLHIHDVDFLHSLLGLPRRVYAQGARAHGEAGGYDHVLASLDYGEDLQVSASAIWTDAHLPFGARFEAAFERAFVRFDSGQRPTLTVYRAESPEPEHPEMPGPDAYVSEIRYFARQVLGHEAPERCLAKDARNSIALVQAELASIARGEPVEKEEFV